jgi:phosphatidate cytidylyltransferase
MHRQRWITALIALPFLIWLIVEGGTPFALLIGGAALISLGEYFRIVFNPKGKTLSGMLLLAGMILGAGLVWATHLGHLDLVLFLVAGNLLLCGLFTVFLYGLDPVILENTAKQIQGVAYVALPLCLLVLIRNPAQGETAGAVWIFFLLSIIFAGDIGAYYVGSNLGRHKLCPRVSPGKTVEGALGGIAGNLLVGSIFKALFLPHLAWGWCLLFFVLAGAAGQVGDLFESSLKRASGIKDSGVVLPGHGGILDRIDALLFAAPVAYLFQAYLL